MNRFVLVALLTLSPVSAVADASSECALDLGSQVEIADCVAATEIKATRAMEMMLEFAKSSAQELDEMTGRVVALPALEASQTAWETYRDAQCDYVGAGFGGGSGTGIAIRSCKVELTRARTKEIESQLR
ncbi:lysozyme inhibitor LprI family protein [Celeribacter naphthalenivorans]|uniref:lysozyme inhibitor LprI family protein n=1 Tax=Celeribacter naphthalenivorans TaxID=1614694 RepID=UPI001CF99FD6|nr:lysozyme inhibitor LprI family protein [Celeribacter naphthalenivorans]